MKSFIKDFNNGFGNDMAPNLWLLESILPERLLLIQESSNRSMSYKYVCTILRKCQKKICWMWASYNLPIVSWY